MAVETLGKSPFLTISIWSCGLGVWFMVMIMGSIPVLDGT